MFDYDHWLVFKLFIYSLSLSEFLRSEFESMAIKGGISQIVKR